MPAAQLIPVGAGILAALLHLSVTTGSSGAFLLAYFAQMPIAAIGLSLGFMPAAVAAAVAAVIVALAAPGVGSLTLFLLLTALPIVLVMYFAVQNRTLEDNTTEWYPLGRILGWLTGLGLFALLVASVVFSGSENGLQGAIERYLQAFVQVFQTDDPAALNAVIATMARVFPGAAVTSWIFMIIINCVLAQQFLSLAGRNMRPKPSYREIDVIIWPAFVAIAAALAIFIGGIPGFIGLNALIVALVPFFFIGMAVLHSISAAWPGRPLLLAGIYITLILLLWPAAFIALLGIAEKWIGLRDRVNRSRTNKGND